MTWRRVTSLRMTAAGLLPSREPTMSMTSRQPTEWVKPGRMKDGESLRTGRSMGHSGFGLTESGSAERRAAVDPLRSHSLATPASKRSFGDLDHPRAAVGCWGAVMRRWPKERCRGCGHSAWSRISFRLREYLPTVLHLLAEKPVRVEVGV